MKICHIIWIENWRLYSTFFLSVSFSQNTHLKSLLALLNYLPCILYRHKNVSSSRLHVQAVCFHLQTGTLGQCLQCLLALNPRRPFPKYLNLRPFCSDQWAQKDPLLRMARNSCKLSRRGTRHAHLFTCDVTLQRGNWTKAGTIGTQHRILYYYY